MLEMLPVWIVTISFQAGGQLTLRMNEKSLAALPELIRFNSHAVKEWSIREERHAIDIKEPINLSA